MAADGRIIIDTSINQDGFVEGSKDLEAHVRRLADSLEGLKSKSKISLQKQVDSFSKLNTQYALQARKIEELKQKINEYSRQKIPTQEYVEIQKQIDSTQSRLDNLMQKQEKFLEMDGNENSKTYKSIQYDIDNLSKTLVAAKNDLNDLEDSGKAFTLGGNTEKVKQDMQTLAAEEAKLDDMSKRLNTSYKSLKQQIVEYQDSISKAATYTGFLQSTMNGLKIAARSPAIMLELLGKVMKKLPSAAVKVGIAGLKKGFSSVASVLKNLIKHVQKAALALAQMVGKGIIGGLKKLSAGIFGIHRNSQKAGYSMGNMIKSAVLMGAVFRALSGVMNGIKEGLGNLAQYSGSTNATISSLMSSLTQLKNAFATAFAPILTVVAPVLNFLIDRLTAATTAVAQFMAAITGQKTFTKAVKVQEDYAASLKGTGSAASQAGKDAKKALAPFDDLVQIQQEETGGGAGGGGGAVSPSDMFTEETINSEIGNFASTLRELFNQQDWAGIGELIGNKINQAVQSFTNYISWESIGAKITAFVTAFTTTFNSLIGTIDWYSVGIMLGTGIDTLANTLYLLLTQIDWQLIGSALAEGLNGLVDRVDWELFGSTLGAYFQAKISALYGFVSNADWPGIGQALGDSLNGLIGQIDWEMLGLILSDGLNGAIAALSNFAATFNWIEFGSSLATSLSTFFKNFDWAAAGTAINDIVIGILNSLITFITETDWWAFGESVATALENIDWAEVANRLFTAIGAAIGGLAAFLGGLIADGITAAKDYFDKKIEECGGNIVLGILNGIGNGMRNIAGWIKDNIFTPFINGFKDVFGIHSPSVAMQEMGRYLMEGLNGKITEMVPSTVENFETLKSGINEKWEFIKTTTSNVWDTIKGTVSDKTKRIADSVELFGIETGTEWDTWLSDTQIGTLEKWGLISGDILGKITEIQTNITSIMSAVEETWNSIWDKIKDKVINVWNSITGTITGAVDGVITQIENLINSVIGLVNGLINQINKISIDVPETPFSDGFTIGFNIPNLDEVHLPRLATGTVIPPRAGEFAAILGDNRRETEVVSPLSTMKQALLEAIAEAGGLGTGGTTITLRFEGSMGALARMLKPELDREAARKGVNLVIVGGR